MVIKMKRRYVVAWHYKMQRHAIFIVDYKKKNLVCYAFGIYERKIPKRLYKTLGLK